MIYTFQKDKNPVGEWEHWNVLMHQNLSHEANVPSRDGLKQEKAEGEV